jgi:hypothetical protein
MTVADLKEYIKSYPDDMPIAYSLWQPDDIIAEADALSETLTADEIESVLSDVYEHRDCGYGITWESIRCSIQDVVYNRNK